MVCIGDELYVAYNNVLDLAPNVEIRRMLVAKVSYDGQMFTAKRLDYLSEYEGKKEFRSEKNWAPFDYKGEMLLAYSQQPHKILRPVWGTGACETVSSTKGAIEWDWGVLRRHPGALSRRRIPSLLPFVQEHCIESIPKENSCSIM